MFETGEWLWNARYGVAGRFGSAGPYGYLVRKPDGGVLLGGSGDFRRATESEIAAAESGSSIGYESGYTAGYDEGYQDGKKVFAKLCNCGRGYREALDDVKQEIEFLRNAL